MPMECMSVLEVSGSTLPYSVTPRLTVSRVEYICYYAKVNVVLAPPIRNWLTWTNTYLAIVTT